MSSVSPTAFLLWSILAIIVRNRRLGTLRQIVDLPRSRQLRS